MFRIIVKENDQTDDKEFDFMAMEFAIANAAFAALASNGMNDNVTLFIVEGNNRATIADKPMFMEAQRQRRMAELASPGVPPQFRT